MPKVKQGVTEADLENWHLTEILVVDLTDNTGSSASVFGSIDDFAAHHKLDRDEVLRQLLAFAGLGRIGDLAFGFNTLCSVAKLQKLKDKTPEEVQSQYLPNILNDGTIYVGGETPFVTFLVSKRGPGSNQRLQEAVNKFKSKSLGDMEVSIPPPNGLVVEFKELGRLIGTEGLSSGMYDQPLGVSFGSEADVVLNKVPPVVEDYNVLDLRDTNVNDNPES